MDSKNSKVVQLPEVICALLPLGKWSHKGFQNFRDSGFYWDLIESVKSPTFNYPKTLVYLMNATEMLKRSENKDMSVDQIKEMFDSIPTDDITVWNNFFDAVGRIGPYSGWWEKNQPTWEDRDEWRKVLELKPINPKLKTPEENLEVVFKHTGYCSPWYKPLEGYRYATFEEVVSTGLPIQEKEPILISAGLDHWYFIENKGEGIVKRNCNEIFQNSFFFLRWFRNRNMFVSIVKL
jgi:hypothetical protein